MHSKCTSRLTRVRCASARPSSRNNRSSCLGRDRSSSSGNLAPTSRRAKKFSRNSRLAYAKPYTKSHGESQCRAERRGVRVRIIESAGSQAPCSRRDPVPREKEGRKEGRGRGRTGVRATVKKKEREIARPCFYATINACAYAARITYHLRNEHLPRVQHFRFRFLLSLVTRKSYSLLLVRRIMRVVFDWITFRRFYYFREF